MSRGVQAGASSSAGKKQERGEAVWVVQGKGGPNARVRKGTGFLLGGMKCGGPTRPISEISTDPVESLFCLS